MNDLPPQNILVTGGAGFIGSHLVERLLNEQNRVTVIDDCSTGSMANLRGVASHPRLSVFQEKISQCSKLPELVAESDFIFHLAAAVGVELVVHSPIRTMETNLNETEVILRAAGAHGVPFLFTSTSEVYGKSQKSAFGEEDDLIIGPPHLGRWSYACSKLVEEFLALAYAKEKNLKTIVVRLFNTVGPRQTGQYGMVLPRFIEAAKAGRPINVYGTGQQTRCFCYVSDAVEALMRLRRCPEAIGQIFNVGGTEETSIMALAELVIRTLGSASTIERIPYEQAYASGFEDMLRRRPLVDKLERTVGFRPRLPLAEIIQRTAKG